MIMSLSRPDRQRHASVTSSLVKHLSQCRYEKLQLVVPNRTTRTISPVEHFKGDNWSFHRINEWLKESCISLFGNPVTCVIADFATIFASAPNNVLHNAKALDSTRSVAASQTYPHHLKTSRHALYAFDVLL